MRLAGRLLGASGRSIRFADDLHESVAWGDARYADLCSLIRGAAARGGRPPPGLPEPPVFEADAPDEIPARDLGAVVFTSGYRPRYHEWIELPGAFDDVGFPIQRDGASTVVPGLCFMGTHFLRKRTSSTLFGMGEDAAIVTRQIAEQTDP